MTTETTTTETSHTEKPPFFSDLVARRVPQVMGVYFSSSWGIIMFIDWLTKRYLLSPHLVELALVILASLIPSTLLVSYYHGKPGRDNWRNLEKVAVPLNFLLAFMLIFMIFSGKDLGRISKKITVQDEAGKQIERSIPKAGYRKKVALFYFDNKSGDTSIDWMQYGILNMLEMDLAQDLFMDTKSPNTVGLVETNFYYLEKITTAGYTDGIALPLLLMKKIAEETYMDYFL
ncbi:MAG: hypothetical protein GY765_11825, partial [bacterium]|nr:hypothetical protein [bacterium]